jgi:hypothetical protein
LVHMSRLLTTIGVASWRRNYARQPEVALLC